MKKSNKKFLKTDQSSQYEKNEFDEKVALEEAVTLAKRKKVPTSVALDHETILDLKELAMERGIPYQVLMRSYILQGLKKDKAS